jgi:hypothetical protein
MNTVFAAGAVMADKLDEAEAELERLKARAVDVDDAVTAICVMIRKAAEAHRDPSDPYPTSGTYAAATFAEELADDIANGEWRKHLRTPHDRGDTASVSVLCPDTASREDVADGADPGKQAECENPDESEKPVSD